MASAKLRTVALLTAVPLVAALVLAADLDGPFDDGYRGACGAFIALMAHHHLELGPATTGGIPVMNPGAPEPAHLAYNRHHPPTNPLLVWAAFAVLGESEASARLVSLCGFTLFLLALAALGRRLGGRTGALVAPAVGVLAPMGSFYALLVNVEVTTLAAWTLALAIWAGTSGRAERGPALLGLCAFGLACLLDWPIGLAVPFLALAAWKRTHRLSWTLAPAAVGTAVFGLVSLWQHLQAARYGFFIEAGSLATFLLNVTPLAPGFDLGTWLVRQGETLWHLAGWSLPAAAVGTWIAWRRRRPALLWLLIALAVALSIVWVFAVRSLDHESFSLYFLPWLALGSTEAVVAVAERVARRARAGAAALLSLLLLTGLAGQSWRLRESRPVSHTMARRGATLGPALRDGEVGLTGAWNLQVAYYALPSAVLGIADPGQVATLRSFLERSGLLPGSVLALALDGKELETVVRAAGEPYDASQVRVRGEVLTHPLHLSGATGPERGVPEP